MTFYIRDLCIHGYWYSHGVLETPHNRNQEASVDTKLIYPLAGERDEFFLHQTEKL
jgi:hypothetical protein